MAPLDELPKDGIIRLTTEQGLELITSTKNEQIDENESSTDNSDNEPPENNMADTFLQCELSNLAASLQLSCRLVYVKLRGTSLQLNAPCSQEIALPKAI